MKIPRSSIDYMLNLNIYTDITFSDLINKQCYSIIQGIDEITDIPYDLMIIDNVDEKGIGKLMYF